MSNTHAHTHTHTHTFYIKTPCPAHRIEVTITLESEKTPKDAYVEGKPTDCNHKPYCHFKQSPKCYLKAIYIKGRKRGRTPR